MRPTLEAVERRRRLLRTVLFLIIVGTLPFYCLGFWLWGTSADRSAVVETITPVVTRAPLGLTTVTVTVLASITPFAPPTQLGPLQPTPGQFIPLPTRFITATPAILPPTTTPVVIPSSTTAPSLTPFPSATPFPTDIPLPSATPPPTETPTVLLPPTDTEVPPAAPDVTDPVGP